MSETKDLHYIYNNISEKYGESFIKNFPKIANHISQYINNNTDVLQTKNVGKHLYYTKAIENDFFECVGVDKNEIVKIVSSAPSIPYKYNDEKEPIYNLLVILSCFYEIHQNEMEKIYGTRVVPHEFIRMYFGLRVYSICQRQIFHYDCNPSVMEYTINNLNRKYIITKVDNVYKFIEYFVQTNKTEKDENKRSKIIDFKNICDKEIYEYTSYLITRLKDALKQIYKEFKINYDAKKTIVTEEIQLTSGDGKSYLPVTTSVSNTIDIHTKRILQSFVQDAIRRNLVEISCKKCNGISTDKTIIVLNSIRNSRDSEMLTGIIRDVLSYWVISLKQGVESIHSINFIKKLIVAYSISNTYDIFISDLKKRLNTIIVKYGSDYIDTEKRSTLSSFKQAVYLYLVFYISSLD